VGQAHGERQLQKGAFIFRINSPRNAEEERLGEISVDRGMRAAEGRSNDGYNASRRMAILQEAVKGVKVAL
jgi:hypothetical protein